jgi:hypothetical protein
MEEPFPALEAKESKGSERCRERPHTAATNRPGQRRMARLIIILLSVVALDLASMWNPPARASLRSRGAGSGPREKKVQAGAADDRKALHAA